MAQDSKLKLLIVEKSLEAGKFLNSAQKESVDAEVVAKAYLEAITLINDYCKERNRY